MKQLTQASCPERPDMYNYGPHTTGPCILLYKIFHLMREGMSYRTVAMKVNVVRKRNHLSVLVRCVKYGSQMLFTERQNKFYML